MNTEQVIQEVVFKDLGHIDYREAWDYQEKLLKENVEVKAAVRGGAGNPPEESLRPQLATRNYLLFCEHPPVYTLGKSGHQDNLLINDQQLAQKGIQFVQTNRGGDITFHGPEQIVGYPILDLEKFFTDIGKYLRSLEEVIILTLGEYGIKGSRSPGETGVWIEPELPRKARKICAMGVRCSRWITMHGFALNVNTDLNYFNYIIPCGIAGKQVTSMEKELGHTVQMEEVKEKIKRNFAKVFGMDFI
ncbi:MAG TPA: lipoyl(octanoyl) transferase LipB [Chitinophagaceae bacterium]